MKSRREKEIEAIKVVPMPRFNATLVGGDKGAPQTSHEQSLPISDHDIIVANTAAGPIVSLNVWCPGSPISPPMNPKGLSGMFRIQDIKQQEMQIDLLAQYLFTLAKNGAVAFMLQEIPKGPLFNRLNMKVQELCAIHNKNFPAQPLNLAFSCQHDTVGTQSSTCALVNTDKIAIKDQTKNPYIDPTNNDRYGFYNIQSKTDPSVSFDIYNMHGDYGKQAEVKSFIENKVKAGAMVCGDFNLQPANQPSITIDKHNQVSRDSKTGKKLGTLDGFYDPVTPKLMLAPAPKPSAPAPSPAPKPSAPAPSPAPKPAAAPVPFIAPIPAAPAPAPARAPVLSLFSPDAHQKTSMLEMIYGFKVDTVEIYKGKTGMVQFWFEDAEQAKNFQQAAAKQLDGHDPKNAIVLRSDSPNIIRISKEQYEKFLGILNDKYKLDKSHLKETFKDYNKLGPAPDPAPIAKPKK